MTLPHSLTPATKQSQKGCPKTTTASLGFGRSARSNTRRLASSCFLTGVTIDDLIDGIEVTTRDDDTFELLRCSYFDTLIVFDRNCPPPKKKGRGGKRRGWDSNPRCPCGHAGFQDQSHQPLDHLSTAQVAAKQRYTL